MLFFIAVSETNRCCEKNTENWNIDQLYIELRLDTYNKDHIFTVSTYSGIVSSWGSPGGAFYLVVRFVYLEGLFALLSASIWLALHILSFCLLAETFVCLSLFARGAWIMGNNASWLFVPQLVLYLFFFSLVLDFAPRAHTHFLDIWIKHF